MSASRTSSSLPLPAAAVHPAAGATRLAWWAWAAAFAWLAATAWLRPLMLPDEGRYAGVALEMLRSGHWGVPLLDGMPFFHKPPLYYWIAGGAMSALGVHEWAARLPSLLAATLGACTLHHLALRWSHARHARWVLLVLLVQPLWFVGAQFANMDMLVAGCITASIALAAQAVLARERGLRWRGALLAAFAMAGLAVLAKGLIGAVLPVMVLLAWLGTLRRWRAMSLVLWLPGLALFAVITVPWFVRMQALHPGFLHYFFVVQHFERYAQSGFNNPEPLWFYPAVLVVLALPWTLWLAAAMLGTRWRAYWQRVRAEPLHLLMWLWVAVVVGFFSLPQSKLLGYVLPAVPPLAWLLADALRGLRHGARTATLVLGAVLCVGVVLAVAEFQPRTGRPFAQAWAAAQRPGEPLYFIDEYDYDLVFYAPGLPRPVVVVSDWSSPEVRRHDNWQRELAEAADFAPGPASLLESRELPARLCRPGVSWVLAPESTSRQWPVLAAVPPLHREHGSALWRLDATQPQVRQALGCR